MNGVWRDREREGREPGIARVVYLDAEDEGLYGVEIPVPEPADDTNARAMRKAIYTVARMLGINYRTASVMITTESGEVVVNLPPTPWPPEIAPLLPGLYRIQFA